MGILKKLFGSPALQAKGATTTQQIEDIFAYGALHNLSAASMPVTGKLQRLGSNISWESEPGFYRGYHSIRPQKIPAHIKWQNNPFFAYMGVVDGAIEYRYSEGSGATWYTCPPTTNPDHIQLIDRIFLAWYQHLQLPQSLHTAPDRITSNAFEMVKRYLSEGSTVAFHKTFSGTYDAVMWVDWREEDDAIIRYCEDILQTGRLSATVKEVFENPGFELIIEYGEMKRKVPYRSSGADRDTTLVTLNDVIQPDYEIRFCKASAGSDTLAFLPLAAAQWKELEKKYGAMVLKHFSKVSKSTAFFS